MSKLDRIVAEALLFRDKPPTTKPVKEKKSRIEKMVREEIEKVILAELKKKFEPPKDDKKKDTLTFWQKVVLVHLGALAYLATLGLLFRLVFPH